MCQGVLVSCGGHCVVDLGEGKDSYLGLPVSHREEEGNGGKCPMELMQNKKIRKGSSNRKTKKATRTFMLQ